MDKTQYLQTYFSLQSILCLEHSLVINIFMIKIVNSKCKTLNPIHEMERN